VAKAGLPPERDAQLLQVAKWHQRKTVIYTEMVEQGKLPPRPGISRIVEDAEDAGWRLAVASTSAEASVNAILNYAVGPERAGRFDLVLAGDCVTHKKPSPEIYLLALERLQAVASELVVIEDSRNGLVAATQAGLRCVITVNGYTELEDFSEAILVVSSLGDPDREVTHVLANRGQARPGAYITLADLEACLGGRLAA
jgi:HAD superfamily hydrolase (TIGR01509 family)